MSKVSPLQQTTSRHRALAHFSEPVGRDGPASVRHRKRSPGTTILLRSDMDREASLRSRLLPSRCHLPQAVLRVIDGSLREPWVLQSHLAVVRVICVADEIRLHIFALRNRDGLFTTRRTPVCSKL